MLTEAIEAHEDDQPVDDVFEMAADFIMAEFIIDLARAYFNLKLKSLVD